MTPVTVYGAHGLVVRSSRPLPGVPQEGRGVDPVDLDLRWGSSQTVPDRSPRGEVVLHCMLGGRLQYVATAAADGLRLRFARCCEFHVPAAGDVVHAHTDPKVTPEIGAIIAAGSLLSFVLTLRGHTVLHASAVATPHGAVAVTGMSGSGKSTVAALGCAGGLPLVTDDVLRVDHVADGTPTVRMGANELRLRPASRSILAQFTTAVATRETADRRLAVRPVAAASESPLAAVVLPRPRRDRRRIAVRRLSPSAALLQLLAVPRLLGWQSSAVLSRQLRDLTRLASRVPVVEVDVPWGPPFAPDLAAEVADVLTRVAADAAVHPASQRRASRRPEHQGGTGTSVSTQAR